MLNVLNVVGPPSCPTGYVVKVGHMPGVTAPQACADELTDCPVHKQNGGCLDANSHHVNWRRLCTKTCGYCDIPFYTRGRKGGNALAGGSTANVVSAEACGERCTDHPNCHSFEYSPYRATCNRNTLADPTLDENYEDYVFCSSCAGGHYKSNPSTCTAYGGSCSNGALIALASRRQQNHCGECNAGFYLITSSKTCAACAADEFKPGANAAATECTPKTYNHCEAGKKIETHTDGDRNYDCRHCAIGKFTTAEETANNRGADGVRSLAPRWVVAPPHPATYMQTGPLRTRNCV